MDPLLALQVFVLLLPAELPDKTFAATLVLSTRYRPTAVWAGVAAAFAVQTTVAVSAGGLVSLLPRRPVLSVVAVLFAVGAVFMLRGAGETDGGEGTGEGTGEGGEGSGRREKTGRDEHALHPDGDDRGPAPAGRQAGAATTSTMRAAATSFAVLFAAEWGDLSQLLTAGLAARYSDPVSVFAGAWVALATVAGLAVLVGRTLARVVPLSTVRRGAGVLFAVLSLVTAWEAAGL